MHRSTNMKEDNNRSGFFEFLSEEGCSVDLTQPGLLSRRQLVSILRKRGLSSLLEKAYSTSELVSVYFQHVLPLPSRECVLHLQTLLAAARERRLSIDGYYVSTNCSIPGYNDRPVDKNPGFLTSSNRHCKLFSPTNLPDSLSAKSYQEKVIIINNPKWSTNTGHPASRLSSTTMLDSSPTKKTGLDEVIVASHSHNSTICLSSSTKLVNSQATVSSLDNLVIHSNPNWITSGDEPSVAPGAKEPASSTSKRVAPSIPVQVPHHVPLKRPKLNRAFGNHVSKLP